MAQSCKLNARLSRCCSVSDHDWFSSVILRYLGILLYDFIIYIDYIIHHDASIERNARSWVVGDELVRSERFNRTIIKIYVQTTVCNGYWITILWWHIMDLQRCVRVTWDTTPRDCEDDGDIDTSRRANYNGTYLGLPIYHVVYNRHALAGFMWPHRTRDYRSVMGMGKILL